MRQFAKSQFYLCERKKKMFLRRIKVLVFLVLVEEGIPWNNLIILLQLESRSFAVSFDVCFHTYYRILQMNSKDTGYQIVNVLSKVSPLSKTVDFLSIFRLSQLNMSTER